MTRDEAMRTLSADVAAVAARYGVHDDAALRADIWDGTERCCVQIIPADHAPSVVLGHGAAWRYLFRCAGLSRADWLVG